MNERIVVEHATKVQVANLAQSRTLKVTKPQGDQSIVLDLSDRNATFDLSAVADEKMTLVKVGPKLVILFDNQSTVTADPFFDFSGKPLANLDVELGTGRAISGEQFAQLFSITEDQSVLHAAGIIPPSGADFHDASVDVLAGMRPLALLEQEGLAARASDADDGPFRHNIAAVSPNPTVTVPSPGGLTTTVFEAGLLASRGSGESAGTHPGQSSFPTTTKAGAISFSSPADVFTYTIQDADGTLAHTTLTITLGDAAPTGIVIPAPGGADTQVFEAGLLASRGPGESAGSHAGESASRSRRRRAPSGLRRSSPTPGFVRTACEIALLIENHSARTSVPTAATSERTAAIRRNCIQLPRTNHGSPTLLEKLRKTLSTS